MINLSRRLAASLDALSRAFAVLLSGSVARLALGFIASVLTARALGPASFGVYAVLGAAAGILGAVADLGLTEAGVRRIAAVWQADRAAARSRARVFFWLRVGVAALIVAAGCLLSGLIAEKLLGLPEGGPLLALALLGVAATAASGAVNALLQATGAYGRLSIVLLTNSGLTAVLAVALALAGWLNIVTALVVLGIGTSVASFVVGWRMLPAGMTFAGQGIQHTQVREAQALLRFGRWLWVANLFAMLAAYLDVLLMNHLATPAAVGVYALALNLANKADVVNQSLYAVLLPAASALRSRVSVRQYVRRSLARSALISLVLVLLLPLAKPLITLFYGQSFAAAAGLFQLLLGVVIFDICVTPLLLLAFTYDQPELLAAADALRVVALLALAVWLIPLAGPAGAVVARLGARVAGAALVLAWLARQRRATRQHPPL